MAELSIDQFGEMLRGRMGLIIGPGATKFPGCMKELHVSLASDRSLPAEESLFAIGDVLLEQEVKDSEIMESIREKQSKQKKSALLTHLTKVRWAAVLSLSLDSHFEDDYRQYVEKNKPNWPQIAAITDASIPHPANCIPILKLLGAVYQDNFAFSTATYLDCQTRWRIAASTFAHLVKGNPVLCVGMEEMADVLSNIVREFLVDRTTTPSVLLLTSGDPIQADRTLQQLTRQRMRIVTIGATLGDVCRAATTAAKSSWAPTLDFASDDADILAPLSQFREMVTFVNAFLVPSVKAQERTQLLDLLFAPAVPQWDPQAHDLDFCRTHNGTLFADIQLQLASGKDDSFAHVVTGSAATGKTMLLKRVAFDLAKTGHPVLWLTPWSFPERPAILRQVFESLRKASLTKGKRVVIVIDDPISCDALPKEAISAAQSADVSTLLLTAFRTSDWLTCDQAASIGNVAKWAETRIADSLDDAEWASLSQYLVSLGIAADVSDATRQIDQQSHRAIRDTLCMLYFLMPNTRSALISSVRQEHDRLGDARGIRSFLLGNIRTAKGLLKQAYNMVAVANHYHANLPIEVLVSALRIDYQTWVDATPATSAAWGLLYPLESMELQTVTYRTRNEVVTSLVVEVLNGGSLGHSGELPVLRELLAAGVGKTLPVFLDFCRQVLVGQDKLKGLSFEEGMQLYETANQALYVKDKTLLHHQGLWIKNIGKDPVRAIEVFKEALEAPPPRHPHRAEADEHIHNSIAAAELEAIKKGESNISEAKVRILSHLAKARSADFFNAKSVHVQANLVSQLIDELPASQPADMLALVNKGVADVDRTLLTLHGMAKQAAKYVHDINMLQSKRDELLVKVSSIEDLQALAEQVWKDFRSQEGFILAARKLYAIAQQRDKKYNEAFSYAQRKIIEIRDAGEPPAPSLVAVAAEIYYRWQVQRGRHGQAGSIDWSLLEEYSAALLTGTELASEPFYGYLRGLSLAHLGRWNDANTRFAQLRRGGLPSHVMWARQDPLLDEEGTIRVVQGTVKESVDRVYLFVEQFQRDFYAARSSKWPPPGQIAFATIEFTYAGPTAYFRDRS